MDPTKIIDKAVDAFDDNHLSEQESEDIRTERHRIDMNSDNWWAKANRPINTMYTGVIWGISVFLWFGLWFKYGADFASDHWYIILITGAPYKLALSFYFHGRKQEKIAKTKLESDIKKSDALIKIEKLKTRHELREERRDNRKDRK